MRLNLLAARAPEAAGNLYNGGTGGRYTLNQAWAMLNAIAGTSIDAEYAPAREGDVRDSQADLTAAGRDLAYQPDVDFEEGLRRTLAWYREVG